jgi:chloramphenicol-sensitive protein RarD
VDGSTSQTRIGFLYGLAAYGWWGLVPFYFDAVSQIPSQEVLAHRIVWSALLLILVITGLRQWPTFIRCAQSRETMIRLMLSTTLIGCNWYVYIYSVLSKQALQGSLGYFILPLVNVGVGLLFFGEKLRPAQVVALVLASLGVAVQIIQLGVFPWIALTLAFSFCFYGVVRKQTPVDAIVGLTIETLLLTPISLFVIGIWAVNGELVFAHRTFWLDGLVILSGVVTTVPLICFSQAMRRLPLITMGFLQYISPTIAFFIAVLYLGESFTPTHQISFAFIWAGLAVFVIDAIRATRKLHVQEPQPVVFE